MFNCWQESPPPSIKSLHTLLANRSKSDSGVHNTLYQISLTNGCALLQIANCIFLICHPVFAVVLPVCPPPVVSISSQSSPEVLLWSLNLSILRCFTYFFLSFFSHQIAFWFASVWSVLCSAWSASQVLGVRCAFYTYHFHWSICASKLLLQNALNSEQLVGLPQRATKPWSHHSLKRQDGPRTFKGVAQLSHKTPASPLIYPWVPQVIWLILWRNAIVWHWHWNGQCWIL